jgi:flagellar basal body-associated protein FliL
MNDHEMFLNGWTSPDTYGPEYAELPKGPGLYVLVAIQLNPLKENYMYFEIAYVGMSKKLQKRLTQHHVAIDDIVSKGLFCKRFTRIHPSESLRSEERRWIQTLRPSLNVMGNRRLGCE